MRSTEKLSAPADQSLRCLKVISLKTDWEHLTDSDVVATRGSVFHFLDSRQTAVSLDAT
jgi:hypothetical protein